MQTRKVEKVKSPYQHREMKNRCSIEKEGSKLKVESKNGCSGSDVLQPSISSNVWMNGGAADSKVHADCFIGCMMVSIEQGLFWTYHHVTNVLICMDFGVAGSIIRLNITPYQHTYSGVVVPSIEARERQDNQATNKCRIRSQQWPASMLHLGNVSYS